MNVLIHAHNTDSPKHVVAREWWDRALAGPEGIGLAWVTVLGFIRIATHRGVLRNPMSPADACSRIEEWLALPHVHIPVPAEGHFAGLCAQFEQLGTAGNLTTDAHLATLAMARGYLLCTTDMDFGRFHGLKWTDPLQTRAISRILVGAEPVGEKCRLGGASDGRQRAFRRVVSPLEGLRVSTDRWPRAPLA